MGLMGWYGRWVRECDLRLVSATRAGYVYANFMRQPDQFLPPHGNYRELRSYQKAEVIFDLTHHFCGRFLSKGDRTVDQMVPAARSGKQNILEGCQAGGTSKETELRLTNVARGSLAELLADYGDFLRVRKMATWEKTSKEALQIRKLGARAPQNFELYREFCETRSGEVVANIASRLIHQANYLLDQQIRRLQSDFLQQGGLRERMSRARRDFRTAPEKRQP